MSNMKKTAPNKTVTHYRESRLGERNAAVCGAPGWQGWHSGDISVVDCPDCLHAKTTQTLEVIAVALSLTFLLSF